MYIQDYELTEKIHHTFAVGMKFNRTDGEYIVKLDNNIRNLCFDILSYIGVSPGAIHYYGKIWEYGIYYENIETGNKFSFGPEIPDVEYTIHLTRLITKEEVEKQPDRFKGFKSGERTECFNDFDKLYKYGTDFIKQYFTGNWAVKIDFPHGTEKKFYLGNAEKIWKKLIKE